MAEALPLRTSMNFAYGEPRDLAPGVVRIVANNPNHFTFKGTNTYLVGTRSLALIDPAIRFPKLAVGVRLAKRWLGQRAVMDVIPLDASLVRGSHGRADLGASDGPIFITSDAGALEQDNVGAVDVKRLVLSHVFSDG